MTVYNPKLRPKDFGMKQGDYNFVVSAISKTGQMFNHLGVKQFLIPALADGQHPNWRTHGGDTPPGLYKIGEIFDDRVGNTIPDYNPTHASFGPITYDMVDLEGNENKNGRAGICIHGGGSNLGWPAAWDDYQSLLPTYGCVRLHNADLVKIYNLMVFDGNRRFSKNTIFVSVIQDDI
jgi:hypothetical protein